MSYRAPVDEMAFALIHSAGMGRALGERLYGRGAEFADFYYLYFGVGLGGTMVHDGAPLRIPQGVECPVGGEMVTHEQPLL